MQLKLVFENGQVLAYKKDSTAMHPGALPPLPRDFTYIVWILYLSCLTHTIVMKF